MARNENRKYKTPLVNSIINVLMEGDCTHISDIILKADSDSVYYRGHTISITLRRLIKRGVVERVRRGFYRLSKTSQASSEGGDSQTVR